MELRRPWRLPPVSFGLTSQRNLYYSLALRCSTRSCQPAETRHHGGQERVLVISAVCQSWDGLEWPGRGRLMAEGSCFTLKPLPGLYTSSLLCRPERERRVRLRELQVLAWSWRVPSVMCPRQLAGVLSTPSPTPARPCFRECVANRRRSLFILRPLPSRSSELSVFVFTP